MQIVISAKNFTLTPSIRAFVEEKFIRLEHHWSRILRANVELGVQKHHKHGDNFLAFVHLETPGPDIRASADAPDIRSAVDQVYEKLEKQVMRMKDRLGR